MALKVWHDVPQGWEVFNTHIMSVCMYYMSPLFSAKAEPNEVTLGTLIVLGVEFLMPQHPGGLAAMKIMVVGSKNVRGITKLRLNLLPK